MRSYRAVLAALILILFSGCSRGMDKSDITSVSTPLRDQQAAIWKFEKELECMSFAPCFHAIVDGALDADPENAVKKCGDACFRLKKFSVPNGLPERVAVSLEEARAILERHAAWSFESARFAAGMISSPAGFLPDNARTCDAYSRIDKVNRLYGLKDFMEGSYINCDVLNEPAMPEFPGLDDLE